MVNKQYAYLVVIVIVAFLLVVFRSLAVGVEWNPLGFIPKTRVGQLFLPVEVQYLLMAVLIILGIAAAVYAERVTRRKR
jgi:uncharacterized membrane protein